MTPTTTGLRESLERDGFVVIPQALGSEQLAKLREAAADVERLARAGGWPHIRTVGKQFPPWPSKPNDEEGGIWGVQSLLHPDMPGRDEFARLYFSETILGPARELMGDDSGDRGCREEDLVMELLNMLVRPGKAFELRWHRDDIGPDATDDEELRRLSEPAWHAQWNLALWDDDSLILVPGSHARARTTQERSAGPYETGLEGEMRVRLRAGDVAFYNNNIFHRGAYDPTKKRLTIHGSVGHVRGGQLRARNVLQHDVTWIDRCSFKDALGSDQRTLDRAEAMRERLIRLGRESGDVGYSLSG
ncbi:hypothetical protein PpBr36_08488 [Pyricularia pennisetigena]|uniref:hypothetical protein n=1 Tax=Pyricularia pennisetigena TaxID=1578925 RepID=UPI00114EF061|nr:hypothetical protein PpBr36_08488 [Pyricularia pennisetigena]TLS24925.1 hypothetical protein PpBr36_08488 [Pyricularia pennisetigena]